MHNESVGVLFLSTSPGDCDYIRAFHGSPTLAQLDDQLRFQLCPNLSKVGREAGQLDRKYFLLLGNSR